MKRQIPLRKVRSICGTGAAAAFFLLMCGLYLETAWLAWVCLGLGIGVLVGIIIFQRKFYVCPHCGGYLDRNMGPHCQNCGKQLNQH